MNRGPSRTILVTGVSKGLGRALALEMAKRGHTVIGCSRSQDQLDSLQTELSTSSNRRIKHFLMKVDVQSDNNIAEFAKAVIDSKGLPDIIVNNAGTINRNNLFWEVPPEEFDAVIDTNIKGTANVLRHFLPHMVQSKKGIIVNMSSGWGRSGAAQVAPYCTSKWAIEGMTRSVAKELPDGMAIVALCPGVINTEMLVSCFGNSSSLYQTPETWKERPPITFHFLVIQCFLLALCGITANQGFYLLGLQYASPTFAPAMQNSVPAITFAMAAALRYVNGCS